MDGFDTVLFLIFTDTSPQTVRINPRIGFSFIELNGNFMDDSYNFEMSEN